MEEVKLGDLKDEIPMGEKMGCKVVEGLCDVDFM